MHITALGNYNLDIILFTQEFEDVRYESLIISSWKDSIQLMAKQVNTEKQFQSVLDLSIRYDITHFNSIHNLSS